MLRKDGQNALQKLLLPAVFGLLIALIIVIGHVYYFDELADPRMITQPWLLQNGFLQYEHIADEHAPLLPLVLSWLQPLFANDAVTTLQMVHGLLIGATVFIVIMWVYWMSGGWGAVAAAAFLCAWSVRFGFYGMWYNLALSPVYFLFFILLVYKIPRRLRGKMFLLGIITGIAFLLKQHAVLLMLVAFSWQINQRRKQNSTWSTLYKSVGVYGLGLILPIVSYATYYLFKGGTLEALIYWPLLFNILGNYHELGRLPPSPRALYAILPAFVLIVPFMSSILKPYSDMSPERDTRIWLLACLSAAMVFLYPRYSVPHWAVAYPFVAALSGVAAADLLKSSRNNEANKSIVWGFYAGIILLWGFQAVTIYWPYWRGGETRTLLKYEPLPALAEDLEDRLPAEGGLVLLPDNEAVSNLYYLLQRPPPHYWIMNYPWFMNEDTNTRWIEAVEKEQPQTLLYFENLANLAADAPILLEYMQDHYVEVDSLEWEGRIVRIMIRQSSENMPR